MTFKQEAEKLLAQAITRETHKGTVNRVRFQTLAALDRLHREGVEAVVRGAKHSVEFKGRCPDCDLTWREASLFCDVRLLVDLKQEDG